MSMENSGLVLNGADKMLLYRSAQELFNQSFSHPQVVEKLIEGFELTEMENAAIVVGVIADKAAKDSWDNIEEITRQAFAKGMPIFEIKANLYSLEDDREVVDFISDSYYNLKYAELEAAADERTLKSEGSIGMLKYGLGAGLLFFVSSNLYLKWLWASIFVISVLMWIAGYISGRKAKRINQFFNHESDSNSI